MTMPNPADGQDPPTVTLPNSPVEVRPFRDARYRPGEELGHGGMGVVYRCHDSRLGRDVAVKVARDPDRDRMRFVREARLHSKLQHPAIVPVYDLDTAQDGRDFLVMREVEGRTLRKVLKGIAAGEDVGFGRHALLTAFARVCMAVDYCHRRGVLHRDLKPDNVMLGEFGEVYVLDWGIAMERSDATALTGGTKGYAAPEQLAGINDERGDVYSLGVILAEILGANGDDDAPPELLALARRAADADPAARPESPRVLAAAIDRFLDGEHDLALRKKLADAAAEAAMRAAQASDLAAQREAMRLAGRALALDPDHRGAASVLHRVLTAPASATPAEVADKA
jgi:eukaryotic-like serine/threonine-protein kinase